MVKTSTLKNPKTALSICTKIALQMAAKRNATLWRFKVPSALPKKTMVVGIDSSKESRYHCLAMSSSYDPHFTKYYTQVSEVKDQQKISVGIGILIVRALKRFEKETKAFLPELLVIYRDGLCETNKNSVLISELKAILVSIEKEFTDYSPKILYALIHKKIHTRFYMNASECTARRSRDPNNAKLANPQPGTIVDSGIVDPRRYEFLMMPQYVNEGSGMPSRITVLYDTSKLPVVVFEELTSALCYGYYNWQGAIRTPAPCKVCL